MKLRIPTLYSQMDSRWGSVLLGFNTAYPYNIYNYGCLITCIAMVCKYYGYDESPITINNKLKDKKKFVSGGLYVWSGITSIYSGIKEIVVNTPSPLVDSQVKEIKDALDSGYPVMLQVDYNPDTVALDMHYVLAVGYNPEDENDFTIIDPLGGQSVSLKKYIRGLWGNARKVINQYVIYEGKVINQGGIFDPASLTYDDLKIIEVPKENFEGKLKTVEFYFKEWEVEKKEKAELKNKLELMGKECDQKIQQAVQDTLNQNKKDIEVVKTNYLNEIEELVKKHDIQQIALNTTIGRMQDDYNTLSIEKGKLETKVTDLTDKYNALKSKSAEDMPLGNLVSLVFLRLKSFLNKG